MSDIAIRIDTAAVLTSSVPKDTRSGPHIEVVQSLRGVAALAVAWFHFTNGNPHFLQGSILKSTGTYGWLGVEVFFVISGFILPYSLFRANYVPSIANYGRFLGKRISRLDPPYFASIALVIALAYVSLLVPGFRGPAPAYSWKQVLLHIGYMNAFFGAPWLIVVYWSLAIEFQYYLLIGLLFPFLRSEKRAVRLMLLGILGLTSMLVPAEAFVFHYLFLFMIGFAVFLFRTATTSRWEFLAVLAFAFIGTIVTLGQVVAAAGLLSVLAIMTLKGNSAVLAFLGEISYSLYLVHVPIGGRIINFGDRFGGGWMSKVTWLALATGLTLAAAYALFCLIERPCRNYASSIRFAQV